MPFTHTQAQETGSDTVAEAIVISAEEQAILDQLASALAKAETPEAKAKILSDALVANPTLTESIKSVGVKAGMTPSQINTAIANATVQGLPATAAGENGTNDDTGTTDQSVNSATQNFSQIATGASAAGGGGGTASGG